MELTTAVTNVEDVSEQPALDLDLNDNLVVENGNATLREDGYDDLHQDC